MFDIQRFADEKAMPHPKNRRTAPSTQTTPTTLKFRIRDSKRHSTKRTTSNSNLRLIVRNSATSTRNRKHRNRRHNNRRNKIISNQTISKHKHSNNRKHRNSNKLRLFRI